MIPHSRPLISDDDLRAVVETARSGMLAQGTHVAILETELAARFGDGHQATAVGCGAAALQLALHALGVQPDDEVVLPTYVCRAVLQAVNAMGATPVLCDCGPDWVVTAAEVAPKLSPHTRAVVVPHLYGLFADVAAIRALGVPVVEDACQSLAPSGTRAIAGDVAIVSFHPTKLVTGGEGGAVITRSAELDARLKELRDGRVDPLDRIIFSPFSDLSAALAHAQLQRLDQWLARRRMIAERYRSALAAATGSDSFWPPLAAGVFYRFVLRVPGGCDRYAPLFAAHGVTVRRGVDELMHRLLGQSDDAYPQAIRLFGITLSLPLYPALAENELILIEAAITAVFRKHPASFAE